MFVRFRVANHRSIRDEVELSFVAGTDSPFGRPVDWQEGLATLPAVAIYGPNASGKSAILNAVAFLSEAVRESHRSWEPDGGTPRESFALDPTCRILPSLFEVDFVVDGIRFAYGFELDDDGITAEWIYAWPKGRKVVWLERSDSTFEFGRSLQGENRAIEDLTRANSLFLSAAAQNNHAQLMPLFQTLTSGIAAPRTPNHDTLEVALASTARALRDGRRERVVLLVRLADLGIEDVIDLGAPAPPNQSLFDDMELGGFVAQNAGVDAKTAEQARRKLTALRRNRPNKTAAGLFDETDRGSTERRRQEELDQLRSLQSLARGPKRERLKISDLRFRHRGVRRELLTVSQESAGTLSWFALVGQLLDVMDSGGLLCFDELDATLHPALVAEVVSLFQSSQTNPNGAQLLAACNDTTVLSNATENHLHRDQVWLTEKGDDGATSLVPLIDYRVRADQNLEVSYRQGRFGAVPLVSANHLASALTSATVA
jgi:uncharacterized protein